MPLIEKILNHPKAPRFVARACVVLLAANILSLFAAHHWVFDLFVNFRIQYFAGGLILFAACLYYKKTAHALLMALIAVLSFIQMQTIYSEPWRIEGPDVAANLKVVQYNKLNINGDYDDIGAWLRDPANDYDVVIVNESRPDTIARLQAFKDVLPHQYPDNEDERFGDISVLSKHPVRITPLIMPIMDRMHAGTKIVLSKPGLEPVSIYAYHAQVPIGGRPAARRNAEMRMMAEFVRDSKDRNIIFMGDWNLTPWSPLFKDVVKTSGLTYQNYGLMPRATWPSVNLLPVLMIPIDHILFSRGLILHDIERGPSNGSDHHSLIARFYVQAEDDRKL